MRVERGGALSVGHGLYVLCMYIYISLRIDTESMLLTTVFR